uniref:Uncharacterized protein n=1 Tax=Cacopsylla melanoneura TaxID=428564 RepID=A0A8D8STY6_9HEMI
MNLFNLCIGLSVSPNIGVLNHIYLRILIYVCNIKERESLTQRSPPTPNCIAGRVAVEYCCHIYSTVVNFKIGITNVNQSRPTNVFYQSTSWCPQASLSH